jgi:putative transposase
MDLLLPVSHLEVSSCHVAVWMIAERESVSLAQEPIAASYIKQGIQAEHLTYNADRGSSVRSKSLALPLAYLDVTQTHSRPYVSNDNPYSEAQFKTLEYSLDCPDRFDSMAEARSWARFVLQWYELVVLWTTTIIDTVAWPDDLSYGPLRASSGRVRTT